MKNYDSIVVELLSRVKDLEQKVQFLEEEIKKPTAQQVKAENELDEQDEEYKITRSVARQYVMDKIKKQYPILNVQKGTRATGSGIILTLNSGDHKGTSLNAKFYYSKSYEEFPGGWHTVKQADLQNNNIDLHIFTVAHNDNYYTFTFTQEHLRQYVQQKKLDSSNQYYFYFHIVGGKQVESRDGERDVSYNYENWELIGETLNNKINL